MDSDSTFAGRVRGKIAAAVDWYGPARAFATAGSVVVVCIGAWWLLRAPSPPLENSLPFAAPGAVTPVPPTATLAAAQVPSVADRADITVHVVGAVTAPGVYTLAASSRVVDAVEAAGGTTANADLSAVNLALPLTDSDQVYIPARGAVSSRRDVEVQKPKRTNPTLATVPQAIAAATTAPSRASGGEAGESANRPDAPATVNINTADAAALETLPGVGPTTARAIVAHRETNGPFSSPDGLLDVKGIGDAKFAAMKKFVTVS